MPKKWKMPRYIKNLRQRKLLYYLRIRVSIFLVPVTILPQNWYWFFMISFFVHTYFFPGTKSFQKFRAMKSICKDSPSDKINHISQEPIHWFKLMKNRFKSIRDTTNLFTIWEWSSIILAQSIWMDCPSIYIELNENSTRLFAKWKHHQPW